MYTSSERTWNLLTLVWQSKLFNTHALFAVLKKANITMYNKPDCCLNEALKTKRTTQCALKPKHSTLFLARCKHQLNTLWWCHTKNIDPDTQPDANTCALVLMIFLRGQRKNMIYIYMIALNPRSFDNVFSKSKIQIANKQKDI